MTCECPKLLIVDDEFFNIIAMSAMLKPLKIPFLTAVSGAKGIKEAENYI